ncbi:MAG: RtcB family protein, partial [Propioniciclava sp.]
MPVAVPGAGAPTRLWSPLHEVEPAALEQIRHVSKLPWTHGVAVMPDVHVGYGVTIGSVIAMRGAVSPSAVGVDIGCGMNAVRTSLSVDDLPDSLADIRGRFEDVVPVGFNAHDGIADILRRPTALKTRFTRHMGRFGELRAPKIGERERRAYNQCGSLGGGNHFIELCSDADSRVWLMLHSGSRNIGKEIADRHIAMAKEQEWNSDLPDRNLAVFLARDADGHPYPEWADYLHDLYWAQDYAALSRDVMVESLKAVLAEMFAGISFGEAVNCHHNYVAQEVYDDVELVVTRKGAISARTGEWGVIPGSMGTGSYIVRGLGNPASYKSASHGAGRRMSRGAAKRAFSIDDLAVQTAGVECRKDAGVLDEAPGAYKDLDQVIAYESDLVE